ncbi:hypothetical protein FOZ60_009366 [Perkinsus olseni]|uniref:histone deacetylase n=1 Tax=Perkinsus olseni TaxID=32597 RepID=A0A7J6NJQ7_PEROL|nr:hypothetical protein FOZ60_009366 [Perkinsus olseni]
MSSASIDKRIGYVFDSLMEAHRGGMGHPERPSRIRSIHQRLGERGLLERVKNVAGRPATDEELFLVHPQVHVDRVMQFEEEGVLKSALDGGEDSEGPYNPSTEDEGEENYVVTARPEKSYIFPFGADTYVCKESPMAAKLSAGCVLSLIEEIMDEDSPVDRGFACVRPPGHHATTSEAMGFCLFNNVAIAAEALRQRYGLQRVAVVDWDVHHGNGTCEIFAEDPTVLVISIHRFDGSLYYPGTGNWTEMGSGDAVGYNLNVPIDGTYGDEEMQFAFDKLVLPALSSFRPEFILVSCGFDACVNDPLGECEVTPQCYGSLTRQLLASFDDGRPARVALVLEGGYNLDSIAASAEECVRALLETGEAEETEPLEAMEGSSLNRLRSVPLGEPKSSLIRTLHNLTSCLSALPTNMNIPVVPLPRRVSNEKPSFGASALS